MHCICKRNQSALRNIPLSPQPHKATLPTTNHHLTPLYFLPSPARTSLHTHATSRWSFCLSPSANLSWSLLTASGSNSLPLLSEPRAPAAAAEEPPNPDPASTRRVSRHTPSLALKRQVACSSSCVWGSFWAARPSSHITTCANLLCVRENEEQQEEKTRACVHKRQHKTHVLLLQDTCCSCWETATRTSPHS